METLSLLIQTSFNFALSKLTSYRRRAFAAELCVNFFGGSARKMERSLKVSRCMVELGLHERRTGILCVDSFTQRGAKKKSVK
jgi:hypothetical protein